MPKVERLTDKLVRSLRTEETQEEWWDESRPGLYVRVTRVGTRTFCFSYRQPGSGPARDRRRRSMVLGRFAPEEPPPLRFTLADAVEAWKVARGVLAQGIDPLGVSVPASEDGEPGPPVVAALNGLPPAHHERALQIFGTEPLKVGSFGELAHDYMALHAWVEKRRTRDDEQMLLRDLLPYWRDEPATAITRTRMVQRLDDIVRRRGARVVAERVRLLVSAVYNFGISRGAVEINPAHLVRVAGGKAKARDRWLADEEIVTLWKGLDGMGLVFAALIRCELITMQRPGEVAAMEWSEIQPTGWWHIPGTKTIPLGGKLVEVGTKNKLSHVVYLPPLAHEVIAPLREVTGGGRFVFGSPNAPGQPIWYLNKVLTDLASKLGLPHFTRHDLRRTGTTNLQRLGLDHLVDPITNHVPQGVRRSYNLWHYQAEKRAAMEKWDAHLRSILGLAAPRPRSRHR